MDVTKVAVILLLIMFSTAFVRSIMYFEVNDVQLDLTLNGLKVVERRALLVHCSSSLELLSFKWTKKEDPSFTVLSTNMSFPMIKTHNSGHYVCEASTVNRLIVERRNLTIDVLYPPVPPNIMGPKSVYDDDSFNLTCFVDSNPSATYVWKERAYGDIIARGPLYVVIGVNHDRGGPYCFAEHTMIPTIGDPVFTSEYTNNPVIKERVPSIWNLSDGEYETGETFTFLCPVVANPKAKIWWTKKGDDRYTYTGGEMFVFNVSMNFSGWYTCHAENTVHPNGRAVKTTTVSKNVYINITSKLIPGYPTNCPNIQPTSSTETQDNPIMASDQDSTVSISPDFRASDIPDQTNTTFIDRNLEPCLTLNTITLIALITGWVCAVVLLFVSVCVCIHYRKQLISIKQITKDNQPIQLNNIVRALPSIPQPPTSVMSTENTYHELAPPQVTNNKYFEFNTDSVGNDNGGYINPRSSVAQEVDDVAFDLPHYTV